MGDTVERFRDLLDRERRERERIYGEWAKALRQLTAQQPVVEAAEAVAEVWHDADDEGVVAERATRLCDVVHDYQQATAGD